jgi:hypothetical protein
MPARDPREAVLEHLATRLAPLDVAVALQPNLDTVEFVKQREALGCRLYVVEFDDGNGRTLYEIVRVVRHGRTWTARAAAVGAWAEPRSPFPWVSLNATWGSFGFCGGGRVHATDAEVARVRVRFASGVECEDDTDDGWVLFYDDRPVRRPRATVELLDPDGQLVRSFGWPERDLATALLERIPGTA